jgi:hypothetical protein
MKVPDIPLDIQSYPAPVTCGPFIPAVNFATRAAPEGQWFLGIVNPKTGRCVARISALELVDHEDMGIANMMAASWDMFQALESALEDAAERDEDLGCGSWPAVRAAIAKAKGEMTDDDE